MYISVKHGISFILELELHYLKLKATPQWALSELLLYFQAWKRLVVQPNHLEILKEFPPNFNFIILQHSPDRYETFLSSENSTVTCGRTYKIIIVLFVIQDIILVVFHVWFIFNNISVISWQAVLLLG